MIVNSKNIKKMVKEVYAYLRTKHKIMVEIGLTI